MISTSPVDYNTKLYIPNCPSCVIWMQYTVHYECKVALQTLLVFQCNFQEPVSPERCKVGAYTA